MDPEEASLDSDLSVPRVSGYRNTELRTYEEGVSFGR